LQLLNFEICASIKATEQPVQEIFPRYDGNNPETFNLEKPSVIYKYKGLDLRSGFQLRVGDKISKMAPFSSMLHEVRSTHPGFWLRICPQNLGIGEGLLFLGACISMGQSATPHRADATGVLRQPLAAT